ncbi:hypothetical protein SNOG_00359 [Parastagonospora nodorum SN15]|uniref:Uncharacterized protein n=1 Tax=Phaeosphaeria nodorum (strain SN15 / ATCC MYA-4574 / FGSC 10173) TaxID=321614 RepID=Q0V6K5_PHANO|nr:hypothetical protein SNOG_00359 [Parastagonospora nodorum SN15]EAT91854.1 hypothetical protein SNOG_00359 [Parastagonospora nodorum SN15]
MAVDPRVLRGAARTIVPPSHHHHRYHASSLPYTTRRNVLGPVHPGDAVNDMRAALLHHTPA